MKKLIYILAGVLTLSSAKKMNPMTFLEVKHLLNVLNKAKLNCVENLPNLKTVGSLPILQMIKNLEASLS